MVGHHGLLRGEGTDHDGVELSWIFPRSFSSVPRRWVRDRRHVGQKHRRSYW